MSKDKKLKKDKRVDNYRPGTYTNRRTQEKGKNTIAPSQKEMVLEMKKHFLPEGGKGCIRLNSVVTFVVKRFHRTREDAVFVLHNIAGLCYIKIEGEGKGKTISFLI